MNIIKSLIFIFIVSISFQDSVHATENNNPQKLSQEAEKVRTFLNSLETINDEEKINIIEYFNKPGAGEPVCIKNSPPIYENFIKKIFHVYETALFGPSLKQWFCAYYTETLRRNNCYNMQKKEYLDHEIDKETTAVASKLRNRVEIPLRVEIPILIRSSYSHDIESWTDVAHRSIYIDNNTIDYRIEINSSLNKQFSDTLPFRIARTFACLERGSWEPYGHLLSLKVLLGAGTLLIYHFMEGNRLKPSWRKSTIYTCMGLIGITFGTLFTGFVQRQEEKTRDLRAIELAGTDVELENFFSLEPEFVDISSGSDWAIKELKIKKLNKPLNYSWIKKLFSSHYSPADRLNYCQEYAKKIIL